MYCSCVNFDISFANILPVPSHGIAGVAWAWREQAIIIFRHEDGTVEPCTRVVHIAKPTEANEWFPSLLGRDLLNAFKVTYHPPSLTLE